MKIIILIVASNNQEHEADLLCQKNTWVSTCNEKVSVIYLRGWNNDYFYRDEDTLFVPCKEEYSLILNKTILGVDYLIKNLDFDILIRSNVSTYFETDRLVRELNHPKYKKSFFGGYFDKSSQLTFGNRNSFEYVQGAGIFLSKQAAIEICKINPADFSDVFEDLVISNFLHNEGFKKIRIARNNLQSTHFFIPTFYIRTKNSANPESASRRMNLIHEFFQAKNIMNKVVAYLKIHANEISEFHNNSEPIYLYLVKNWVVLKSFLKMKFSAFFSLRRD
jgi:hypothetical protein